MKLWDLHIYNLWIDIKSLVKAQKNKWKKFCGKIQKKWKQFKKNYYGWIVKRMQKKQNKYDIKLKKIISKFYKSGGEYIKGKMNGKMYERTDIKFRTSDVVNL